MNYINIKDTILTNENIELITNKYIKNIFKFEYNSIFTNLGEKSKLFYWFNYYCRILFLKGKHIDHNLENWLVNFINDIKMNLNLVKDIEINIDDFIELLFYSIFCFYIKENWVGPSFYKINCDKKYIKDRVKPSIENYNIKLEKKYNLDFKENINFVNYKEGVENINLKTIKSLEYMNIFNEYFDDYLLINGEDYKKIIKYLNLFIITKIYYKIKYEKDNENYFYNIMWARICNYHQKIMDNNCNDLKEIIFKNYKKGIELVVTQNLISEKYVAMIKIEFANSLIQYHKYNNSKKLILEAISNLGIEINFIGKLGVRTKYQSFKVPHLMVEIKNKEKLKNKDKTKENFEKNIKKEENVLPTDVKLDEIFDNILHEKPVLNEDILKNNSSIFDNIAILSLVNHLLKSSVIEDMHKQEAMSYINKSTEVFKNWTVFSQSLILRSIIEFSFPKTIERAMMQLEQLNIDWLSKDSNYFDRIHYLNFLNYPMRFEYYILHADRYKSTGCFLSASNLLCEIELFEEAVEYKVLGGRKEEAIDFLKEKVKNWETPKIQCLLGDIYKEEKYYLKAWELGNKKYARAKRSLGLLYMRLKNFDKAEESFIETLKINDYQYICWYNLGFIYLSKNIYEKAVTAFSKCIQINDEDVDSWANLAGLYQKLGKIKLAYEASKTAISKRKNDFRLWYNLLIFSFQNQKFMDFLKSISMIINLNKKKLIEEFIIKKINIVFELLLEKVKKEKNEIRPCELAENKIMLIYDQISAFMPENAYIWKYISNFYDLKLELLNEKMKYKDLYFINKIDDYEKNILECKNKALEFILTNNQILLKEDFEKDKNILNKLYESSKELLEKHKKYNKVDEEEYKKFENHINYLNSIFLKFNLEKW